MHNTYKGVYSLTYVNRTVPIVCPLEDLPCIPYKAKDSQKIKIKKKTKTPRITGPSGEEDERREKKEEKTTVSSSKALFRFSSPIGSFYRIGI